jgi:hypothetical protein
MRAAAALANLQRCYAHVIARQRKTELPTM